MDFCRLLSALILLCGLCAANGILVGCDDDDDLVLDEPCVACSRSRENPDGIRIGSCTNLFCNNMCENQCWYEVGPAGTRFYCDDCDCWQTAYEANEFITQNCIDEEPNPHDDDSDAICGPLPDPYPGFTCSITSCMDPSEMLCWYWLEPGNHNFYCNGCDCVDAADRLLDYMLENCIDYDAVICDPSDYPTNQGSCDISQCHTLDQEQVWYFVEPSGPTFSCDGRNCTDARQRLQEYVNENC